MNLAVLYSTFPSAESAEQVGLALVQSGLVACVNILPGAVSIYEWEGTVLRESEVVLIAKTTRTAAPKAVERLKDLHPYQVPCITWWGVEGAEPAYARWVEERIKVL